MNKKHVEILPILIGLSSNNLTRSSLNHLIEHSFIISNNYYFAKQLKLYNHIHTDNVKIEDLAISAIAPLFCRESEKEQLPIIKEFNSWQPPIKTEDEALFFLNKVITGRVEQHISQTLREFDPFFSKILDSVNHLVRTESYEKVSYLGKRYIVVNKDTFIKGKFIDHDSFFNLPHTLFQDRKKMLPGIIQYLDCETDFVAAIPINSLVLRLRHLSAQSYNFDLTANNGAENSDVQEIVNTGLQHALARLLNHYSKSQKLNNEEVKNFQNALEEMAGDIQNGGIKRGLYDYLQPMIPNMSRDQYFEKYHNILEYLVKLMKNKIRDQLTKDNQ